MGQKQAHDTLGRMPQIERQPVVIKSNDGGAQPGALHVTAYSPRARVVRAAKVWAVCWVLALLALPIIGLHWILVPALTLAGVLLGYQRYRATTTSQKIEGLCPVCHSTIEIKLEPAERPPLWKYCPACSAAFFIETPAHEMAVT